MSIKGDYIKLIGKSPYSPYIKWNWYCIDVFLFAFFMKKYVTFSLFPNMNVCFISQYQQFIFRENAEYSDAYQLFIVVYKQQYCYIFKASCCLNNAKQIFEIQPLLWSHQMKQIFIFFLKAVEASSALIQALKFKRSKTYIGFVFTYCTCYTKYKTHSQEIGLQVVCCLNVSF